MLKSIADCFASLVLLPAIALALGGHWTQVRSQALADAALSLGAERGWTYVHLEAVPEHAPSDRGVALGPGRLLEIRLPRPVSSFAVTLQASARRAFHIEVSEDGEHYRPFWVAPGGIHDEGLVSHTSPVLGAPAPVRALRIEPGEGRGPSALGGVILHERVWHLPVAALAGLPWAAWLALLALRRSGVRAAERALRVARRLDPLLAAAALALLFLDPLGRPAATALWAAAALALFAAVRRGVARVGPEAALAATLSLAVAFAVAPRLLAGVLLSRLSAAHDLSVDHRNAPDGDEINGDGARFRGEAADLADGDFVVLFLGDSFTYGFRLAYEETYPAAVERALAGARCSAPVRVVNFGWTSSSPLLGLRLLREVGARYHPDLVVYNLDMTDFQDDLRYARDLRVRGEHGFASGEVLWAALVARLPALEFARARLEEATPCRPGPLGEADAVPRDRFFATNRPLEASRSAIERGVMRNLAALHRTAQSLGAGFFVFVLPRAFQHSRDESPRNWERARYEVLGPWVREPFRYFESVRDELDYGTASLLPAFEAADPPLYLEDDPHWNARGARVAGEAAARILVEAGLLPCPPD